MPTFSFPHCYKPDRHLLEHCQWNSPLLVRGVVGPDCCSSANINGCYSTPPEQLWTCFRARFPVAQVLTSRPAGYRVFLLFCFQFIVQCNFTVEWNSGSTLHSPKHTKQSLFRAIETAQQPLSIFYTGSQFSNELHPTGVLMPLVPFLQIFILVTKFLKL